MLSLSRICPKQIYINSQTTKTGKFCTEFHSQNLHRFIRNSSSFQGIKNSIRPINLFGLAAIVTSIFIYIWNRETEKPESISVTSSIRPDTREKIDQFKSLPHWKLANRISGHSELPKQCIESLLIGIFQEIEESKQIKLSQHTRKKISNSLPKENMEDLKDLLMLYFCVAILDGYSNEQIEEMLEEYEKYQSINNKKYKHSLNVKFEFYHDGIVRNVFEDAKYSMAPSLTRQVYDIARKKDYRWANDQFPKEGLDVSFCRTYQNTSRL